MRRGACARQIHPELHRPA